MGKRRNTLFWIFIITVVVIASIAGTGLLVLLRRPVVLFILDPIYEETSFSFHRHLELLKTTIEKGWFLNVERVDLQVLADTGVLHDTILLLDKKKQSPLLLLSPLVTSAVALGGPLYPDDDGSLVVGMGLDAAKGGFNIGLVTQEPDPGWLDAADSLRTLDNATPMSIAVLYTEDDAQAAEQAEAFINHISSDKIVLLGQPSSANTARQVQVTLNTMLDFGVLIVVSPYVKSLELYVLDPLGAGLQWVVDESYAKVVPSNQLLGTIGDDLSASLEPIFDPAAQKPGRTGTIILPRVRVYRE
jgi:hypothetical protein